MSHVKVGPGKYRIFISDGTNLDGSRRRYSKTVTTDLKGRDLKRFLMEAEFDFEDEVKSKSTSYNDMANKSFNNYADWWLDYADLTDQTRETYMYNLEFIKKHIGKRKLSSLNKSDMLQLLDIVKAKINVNTGEPIAARTVRNHMNVLKACFRDATSLDILSDNPMDNITYTVEDYQAEDNYCDVEDINEMIIALEGEPPVHRLAVLFTLATGVRLGELIAIHESDLNRRDHTVTISKAVSETREGRKLGNTKNKKTTVKSYPAELEVLIDEHMEIEHEKKNSLGVENDLLFTSSKGDFMPKSTISGWFRSFIKRKNLKKISFHGLRHTSATILLASGIPLKNVSERLGHSRASTTSNIYAHAIPRIDKDASDVFSNFLSTGSESGSRKAKLKIVK